MCPPGFTERRPRCRPIAPWSPPLDAEGLARVAGQLRSTRSLEAILDDAGDVLGDQAPPETEFGDLAERLRKGLTHLVDIAVAAKERDAQVACLVQRGLMLRAAAIPGDSRQALAYLRRMADLTSTLLERLADTRTVRSVA
ncbi:DUF6415 family natural product biosynthesis protein [Streptomyces sp. NRRL F-5126]|uniref:DUF6415 family natural product biosynthesis protein n=1 Tax=Streptomyces sp. NRRL F-5126 TaxID=1463857 RepID=UPI00068F1172|nr:DUF6415 family natural product biosynthesis protein [Streptomyces sp. NRRL F-5126]